MNQKVYDFLKCLIPFAVYVGGLLVVFTVYSIYASAVTSDFESAEKLVNSHMLELTTVIDAVLIPVFYLMWWSDRSKLPLKRANMPAFSWSLLALIGASGCVGLNYFLNMFMPQAILESYSETSEVLWNKDLQWLSFLSVVIVAPICEELMFRGLIYQGLRGLGVWKAAVLSALMFALLHLNINQFAYAFVLGIILSLCVEITGSLYSSMILHFLINSRSVALLSSEDMVNSMLTQSSTQPVITAGEYLAGAAVYTPVVILCIAGIWWSLKRLARSCGREDLFDMTADENGKEKIATPALLAGIILAVFYIIRYDLL